MSDEQAQNKNKDTEGLSRCVLLSSCDRTVILFILDRYLNQKTVSVMNYVFKIVAVRQSKSPSSKHKVKSRGSAWAYLYFFPLTI